MRSTQIAVVVVVGVLIAHAAYFYPELPDVMASHFDGSGRPDGWMSKPFFFTFEGILLAVLLLVFQVFRSRLSKVSSRFVNLPNKEYWLDSSRIGEAAETLGRSNDWLCVGIVGLFLTVNHFVFLANINKEPLASLAIWVILISFLGFLLIWSVVFWRRFAIPNKR